MKTDLPMKREELLDELGLPVWRLRDYRGALHTDAVEAAKAATPEAEAPSTSAAAPVASGTGGDNVQKKRLPAAPDDGASDEWRALEAEIRACQACGLCRQRKQAVPGVGDRQADWLFVGEGPGAEEDERGEPFVGQAGRLLDAMLSAIGLQRGDNVYIANAVKCRPPGNRTPEAAEMAACKPFLDRQIALLKPRLIVVLGRAAAHSVLGSDETLSALRGRTLAAGGVPVLVTYHPAYLLRTPLDKAKVWEDLCRARALMRERADAS